MITNIEVTKLLQHPDNPRKNIGDVTELAESIKARGILQNLTVVPAENGMYTVIIGHRRLAAAKQAGLTEVPCAVVDMDYKTQLSTMLLENMQRSDLTVYEQAQGMQMMFNLGVPVAEIVEKTGFAETTVRKRLKIATLPTEQMQQAVERGGKLEDYVRIADIKDEKERRELLKVIGTRDFEFSLSRAKRRQIEAEKTPLVKAELKSIGAKAVKGQIYSTAYERVKQCAITDWKEGTFKKPKNKEELFWEISYGTAYLMRKKAKVPKKKEKKSECEQRIDSANRELKRLTETAYECRVNFIRSFTAVEKYKETIIKWLVMFAGCEITDYCTYDRAYINSEIGSDEKYSVNAPKWRQFIAEDKRAPIVV
ncbi:MAG: ParB/RepB/Spo0J family partition protein, partial [Acutalibacteraceae bacterium]